LSYAPACERSLQEGNTIIASKKFAIEFPRLNSRELLSFE